LKELFDKHRDTIGKVKYASTREEQLCHTEVYADFSKMTTRSMMPGMSKLTLGHGTAALQADSQQAAAKEALIFLKNRGFSRLPPAHYAMFCV
jgi:hypothetical protein